MPPEKAKRSAVKHLLATFFNGSAEQAVASLLDEEDAGLAGVTGFVAVPDAHRLVIPDRPGNKKLLTLTNVLENPAVALLFFVPGRTESLRVTGTVRVTTDPALLAPLSVQGKMPRSGLIVAVALAWLHCGRALIRSKLWEADSRVGADALPSLGSMLADQIAGVEAAEAEARLAKANGALLWGEPA